MRDFLDEVFEMYTNPKFVLGVVVTAGILVAIVTIVA
jgi:hypothetical protein